MLINWNVHVGSSEPFINLYLINIVNSGSFLHCFYSRNLEVPKEETTIVKNQFSPPKFIIEETNIKRVVNRKNESEKWQMIEIQELIKNR